MYSLSHYSGQLLHFTSYLHGPTSYSSHYYGSQSTGEAGQHLSGVLSPLSCVSNSKAQEASTNSLSTQSCTTQNLANFE